MTGKESWIFVAAVSLCVLVDWSNQKNRRCSFFFWRGGTHDGERFGQLQSAPPPFCLRHCHFEKNALFTHKQSSKTNRYFLMSVTFFYFVFFSSFYLFWRMLHQRRRKRSYSQLASYGYDNGVPSPFPSDGGSKCTSKVLTNSSLTVHKDGAYMQVRVRGCLWEGNVRTGDRSRSICLSTDISSTAVVPGLWLRVIVRDLCSQIKLGKHVVDAGCTAPTELDLCRSGVCKTRKKSE